MSLGIFLLYTIASTRLWCGFIWVYNWIFDWTEWVPGINLVYFPHGLRMILVILFAEAGTVGIILGTALMGLDLLRTNPSLGLAQSLVAGAAVWMAARMVLKRSDRLSNRPQTSISAATLDGRSLMLLAFASSVLNASGHVLASRLFEAEADQFEVRFATMFTGDLLGAVILLYALRSLILLIDRGFTRRP